MNRRHHEKHHRRGRVRARKWLAFICLLFASSLSMSTRHAKAQDELATSPSFEAISIRPTRADDMSLNVRMMFEGDGYRATNVTLYMLVKAAYGLGPDRIEGLPA